MHVFCVSKPRSDNTFLTISIHLMSSTNDDCFWTTIIQQTMQNFKYSRRKKIYGNKLSDENQGLYETGRVMILWDHKIFFSNDLSYYHSRLCPVQEVIDLILQIIFIPDRLPLSNPLFLLPHADLIYRGPGTNCSCLAALLQMTILVSELWLLTRLVIVNNP